MALLDDFKARFPNIDPALADQYVPILENVYICYYSFQYDADNKCTQEAILNLIAHLLVLESKSSSASNRNTASKSADGLSVSYEAVSDATSSERTRFFNTTKYGQQFLILTSNRIGGFFV
jgi:hypothetical protein